MSKQRINELKKDLEKKKKEEIKNKHQNEVILK